MSDDRKNIKVTQDTYDLLNGEKQDRETWGQFFERLIESGKGEKTSQVQLDCDQADEIARQSGQYAFQKFSEWIEERNGG